MYYVLRHTIQIDTVIACPTEVDRSECMAGYRPVDLIHDGMTSYDPNRELRIPITEQQAIELLGREALAKLIERMR